MADADADSKPEYEPRASQCQISTTASLIGAHAASCTRRPSRRGVPSRSSRMSRRTESTSNQYGPSISSGVTRQVPAWSNRAATSALTVPPAGTVVDPAPAGALVEDGAAVEPSAPDDGPVVDVVAAAPSSEDPELHAAATTPRPAVPMAPSA